MDFTFLLMMVALFAIFYFLMIRPQQKKMRADQEMRNQLAVGDRVLLTSGIFATITHAGERQFIVELAPDLEVTVLKGSVARKVLPEDEEFEFADEADIVIEEPAADDLEVAAAEVTFDPTAPGEASTSEQDHADQERAEDSK